MKLNFKGIAIGVLLATGSTLSSGCIILDCWDDCHDHDDHCHSHRRHHHCR